MFVKAKKTILVVLTVSLLLSGCVSDRGLLADLGLQKSSHAPNIVLILTDDQDLLLDSMDAMPQVDALLAKRGTTFSNFFVNLPLCCPARTTLLRGQYPHNHGVLTNLWPTGGFAKAYVDGIEQATIATTLQRRGYRTALVGKYLNGYPFKTDPMYIPPGWDEWWAPITDTAYGSYGYQVNHNGLLEEYGFAPRGLHHRRDGQAGDQLSSPRRRPYRRRRRSSWPSTCTHRTARPSPPRATRVCSPMPKPPDALVQRSRRQRQAAVHPGLPDLDAG